MNNIASIDDKKEWISHDGTCKPVDDYQAVHVVYSDGFQATEPAYNVFWTKQEVKDCYSSGKIPSNIDDIIVDKYKLAHFSHMSISDQNEYAIRETARSKLESEDG